MRQAFHIFGKVPGAFLARLSRDVAGNILPIAAIGMLVAALVVGSAVDLSRNYLAREQLQSACDAAVLAGRRTVTTAGFDTASRTAATNYFNTNFNDTTQGTRSTVLTIGSVDDGQTITATATTVLDTVLMRIFGKDSFAISVTCGSSMGVGNADVMMVLDTTGSMDSTLSGSQTRIQALRAAMKNFYTTIYNATAASNARVRYGFVPFSSTVNVGRLLNDLDTRYIVDNYNYQSREWTNYSTTTTTDTATLYSSTAYSSQSACTAAFPSNNGTWTNSGSPTTVNASDISTVAQRQTGYAYSCVSAKSGSKTYYYIYVSKGQTVYSYWRYVYKQKSYVTSSFKGFNAVTTQTGSYGANVSTTWGGCIQERGTVAQSTFSYSSATGISPAAALDLDLDSAPDVTNDNTKWAPLWPEISYRRENSKGSFTTTDETYYGEAGGTYCPAKAQLLSEMTQSAFNTYADSLNAVGGTYLDIGMIWGGRMMSPTGMWKSLVNDDPSNGGEVSRHIIFMTDGQMEPAYYVPQAWGMEYWDRRVTSDGSSNDAARHTSRFLATCEAIKDKGIRVWVIAFTSSLSTDLTTCASDDSSFTANSSTELNAAFQEIAKQVGELRVVQ
ncbi:TadE/TadG family type IV pilus assembly protein [Novosphingobium resinovorum]|uniref:TadE/TadG family type IV pilus assembly protein n=1 Tax=Novosphingobium resinovorum TaxID=158500 RepID=UPI002ED11ACE|nr:TadE/TadG family type IV pilus assembly protein [Novosphingobium resinovorum]